MKGRKMKQWPLIHTTVKAARTDHPNLPIHRIPMRGPKALLMRTVQGKLTSKGMIPFFFRKTMSGPDDRLPEKQVGLGVIVDDRARFFPTTRLSTPIKESWSGREMKISLGEIDHAPHAIWVDDGSRPMQLLSRWYSFAYTYPGCEIEEG